MGHSALPNKVYYYFMFINPKKIVFTRNIINFDQNKSEWFLKMLAFYLGTEFVELIRTDRQFQIKVGGISAAVLSGVFLAGKGRKY